MSRTAVYSALVLRNRPLGESNKEVFLLTSEEGIIRATVFGGAKSKLRSHAAPYNSGKVWIYRDPAKDYGKLSDFDVQSWRPGLRELYERTMAAGGIAETILATHGGGGEWEQALSLAEETLDALETANEELCECLLVYFLWRWAGFLGIQPDVGHCSVCGHDGMEDGDRAFWYSSRENSVLCGNCVPKIELCPSKNRALSPNLSSVPKNQALSPKSSSVPNLTEFNPDCRRWLSAIGQLIPSDLYRYSMDSRSIGEAKSLATAVLMGVLGKRLSSWDW